MEFKGPYLDALIKQDPKGFMELRRSGRLDEHLKEKSHEAHTLLDQLLANEPKEPNGLPRNAEALRRAEEIVRAEMSDFPVPEEE